MNHSVRGWIVIFLYFGQNLFINAKKPQKVLTLNYNLSSCRTQQIMFPITAVSILTLVSLLISSFVVVFGDRNGSDNVYL